MYSLIDEMGLESDRLRWDQIASCKGMEINWFFDEYEGDSIHAEQIDSICLQCPVAYECLQEGQESKSQGVWGGIYLDLGRPHKDHNKHKTPLVWEELEKIHGQNFL